MITTRRSRGFTALKIEGGLLPSEFLQTIATLKAHHQDSSDYELSDSLEIKDELSRYWSIANDLYMRYANRLASRDFSRPKFGIDDWLVTLLHTLFGYNDINTASSIECENRVYRLTHRACGGTVPILLLTHDFDIDKVDPRLGYDGIRRSPHNMMQEYLNVDDTVLWGLVSNGSKFRILRESVSLTRPSYIEIDLDLIFAENLYSDFVAFWLSVHASRLRPRGSGEGDFSKPSNCIMEDWRKKAHETGERALEKLRNGVIDSLRQIGNGFLQHPLNDRLRKDLNCGDLSPDDYFQQLLLLVYRLLFLFSAEERNLLHLPDATVGQRDIYSEGYALARLRERTLHHRYYDHHQDLWRCLQVNFQVLRGDVSGIRLGLSALGGLFLRDHCRDLDDAVISNRYLLEAVRNLAYFRSDQNLARVNYRDMGTEELGSVYESLLELRPIINTTDWTFSFSIDFNVKQVKGSERKLTGTYYTPPNLVNQLIKSTLDPVIKQAVDFQPDNPRAAILDLKVIDPACGSGHFLLAVARRLATEIVRVESGDNTIEEVTRQNALRDVMKRCIYGVDKNRLAVELCKTALWIETIEPGKPLTFLDAHILHGDSLIGILNPESIENGIPDEAYKPLTGDNKTICSTLKQRNLESDGQEVLFDKDQDGVLEVAVASLDFEAMPEETLTNVKEKQRAWQLMLRDPVRDHEALRANIFVGAYFSPKTSKTHKIVPLSRNFVQLKRSNRLNDDVEDHLKVLADCHSFLHWHLAFPEIMQDGGFDVVIGNPPWERIKLQEKEFFELRAPKIANARNKALREKQIRQLNREDSSLSDKKLYREFMVAKRKAEAASQYVRTGGRFPLTGMGDVNTYTLFAETFLQLLNPRGRAGLIVPTGIATDDTTKAFFNHIISEKRLVSLFDFENREAIFVGVHKSYKFCLLTLSGMDTPIPEAEFAFFLHQVEQLKEVKRRYTLSADDFILFNPNTRTCPIFRTRRDMEITRKMYQRAGVLWKETQPPELENNPWGVSFQRMFDMANDSHQFRTRSELEDGGWELRGSVFEKGDERFLPLYEAKLFHQYDHRFATFDGVCERDIKSGKARLMTRSEKSDTKSVVIPRYWVSEKIVAEKLKFGASNQAKLSFDNKTAPPPQNLFETLRELAYNSLSEKSLTQPTRERVFSP